MYLVASWYRTFEMARRITIFYMSSILALGFGGLVRCFIRLLSTT